MKKAIFIIRGSASENHRDFQDRIIDLAQTAGEEVEAMRLKVTFTARRPPRLSIIPFRRGKVAAISMHARVPDKVNALTGAQGFSGAFLVEEAIPVSYDKTWSDGTETPGVCLLTLFHRRPDIDNATFLDRWHNGHTPLSLRLHPLWNYNRNVVTNAITGHDTWYDGIVEEHFRSSRDLLNPMRFFGPPHKVPLHMLQVWMDSRSFIDMKRIEVYLAVEYHIKSR